MSSKYRIGNSSDSNGNTTCSDAKRFHNLCSLVGVKPSMSILILDSHDFLLWLIGKCIYSPNTQNKIKEKWM